MNLETCPRHTMDAYNLVRQYAPASSEIYCFIRGLMQRDIPEGTPYRDHEAAFMAMTFYYMGCIQGVREERQRRKHPGGVKTTPAPNDKGVSE